MTVFDNLLGVLYRLWLYDIEVLSQPWMYWCALIPAILYAMFVLLKWAILTAPIWLPVMIVFSVLGDFLKELLNPTKIHVCKCMKKEMHVEKN
jgi:hypothetical protein